PFKKKSLHQILSHVTLLLTTHANYKNSEIKSFLEGDIEILCEENALKQVFINLIQNSLESMDKGVVTVRTEKRNGY
ncbi:PAS domain-containing sensor histidine kinase, partial [Escherichia coli]|nr:PAS domain-containing sensor histidine kinase [Escherichia coli]